MSFIVVHADDHTLLAVERPVIKRAERRQFVAAVDLLREATSIRDDAERQVSADREAAHAQALAQARTTADATVTDALAELATTIDRHAAERRADIAEAAFAAARAIVGEFDDAEVAGRIVDRTLARLDGDSAITVEVAPAVAEALAARLGTRQHVSVVENASLGATDCRIKSERGLLVASLSVQFDALAARWGLAGT